jgi:ATP-dependent Lhr-like helicase
MLTAVSSKELLRTARHIIIDERHALIDSKRGAHLMLSLARLDQLCGRPLQRIGLSATIEPLSRAAAFLAPEPVKIAAPAMRKEVRLEVTSPFTGGRTEGLHAVWQQIAQTLVNCCADTRTAIAFVDSRAYAEKLAYYVNLVAGEGFARTHHGSLSKEQRFEVERDLRGGSLRLLCATSSMELGIDVGDIDRVFQVGCPLSISSAMQRLGRAGHNPGRVSVMSIFPRDYTEALYSGLAAEVVRRGGVEYSNPPRLCLDVLAQHLVSMASSSGYSIDEILEILPRAYPFRDLSRRDVKDVLEMLAGDFEHERDIPVRPRLVYDRIHERVEGDAYSRMLAVSAGGTIPDKGYYTVKAENGVKLGELDEEFVYESQEGTKFMLGSFAWQIAKIDKDTVTVVPTNPGGARPPYWNGEQKGRRMQTGQQYGRILRSLTEANESESLLEELKSLGLDDPLAKGAQDLIKRQIAATGVLPDDRRILAEHFRDETGNNQIMVHSVFGRPVNQPLAILLCEEAKKQTGRNIKYIDDDDGFILFPYDEGELPDGLLHRVSPDTAEAILKALLPATPLFNMTFRYNAAHALMMGVKKTGRQPLWVQRMRSAEMLDSLVRIETHPLMRETTRECLEDTWDLPGVLYVLNAIRTGVIEVRELHLDQPSPLSLPSGVKRKAQ